MLLNEHQSKRLFSRAGLPVPQGILLSPGDETGPLPDFDPPWFLKAQVLIGGRGKAGGILRADGPEDFPSMARSLFDMEIKGHMVPLIRVEGAADISREFYLSFTVSRERKSVLLTVGRQGGVHIESLGADNLLVQEIRLPAGLASHQVRAAFFHLGLEKPLFSGFTKLLTDLFAAVTQNGLLLAEINPLVLTGDDEFLVLDGKIEVDDNAADLSPELRELYQPEHATDEENTARAAGLSFVKLKGWVGLMVNGAGLAMATMDQLNFSGLPAANFLDLGGGATSERMEIAFDLLFGDKQVKGVFINLFGGILSCEKVALAMKTVLDGRPPAKPMVIRMSGFRSEQGLAILQEMNLPGVHLARNMDQAMDMLRLIRPANAPEIDFPRVETPACAKRSVVEREAEGTPFPIDKSTPVLVQGMTGREGGLHAGLMLEYGTNVVAGVTPFKGGMEVLGRPVYSSVAQAVREHEIGASIIFVPPRMAADAILEAAAARIPWVICITEGIPQHDMLAVTEQLKSSPTRLIGPNTPGIIVPGQTKIGILPATPFTPGPVAVLSRSGTLTYEVCAGLCAAGIGQTLALGIGGDPFIGQGYSDILALLRNHEPTKGVVVLGEIGGNAEEDLARYVRATGFPKPVAAFIAGRTAPPGKRLGHAGAILDRGGAVDDKIAALAASGIAVCPSLSAIPEVVGEMLKT